MKEEPSESKAVSADTPGIGGSGAAKPNEDPPGSNANASAPPAAAELSAEEQMALYEKDLKENDWGHQPC